MAQQALLHRGLFFAGVFLTCLSTLMLQIIETRLLSVVAHYHLAFFSISMAMFGMTAGAVFVYYRRSFWRLDDLSRHLSRLATAYALSTAACVLLQITHAPVIVMSATTIVVWAELAVIMAMPFFFAGIIVSLALTRSPFPVGHVYAVDLIGASVGCLAVLFLLDAMDAISAILATAAIAGLAAALFARSGPPASTPGLLDRLLCRPLLIAAILAVAAVLNSLSLHGLRPIVVKSTVDRRDAISLEQWNSFSRILASKPYTNGEPLLWGPSPTMPKGIEVRQVRLNIDGDAATSMFRFRGDPAEVEFLRYDVTNLAYAIRNSGRAAVIGVGGGRDLLSAWLYGFRDITGVELNPIFIDLLTEHRDFRDFAGLVGLSGIRFHVDEARSWFGRSKEQFDLVQMSMIDTFAATGAGAFSLSENGLYTVEGWRHFIARLSPTGIFTVSRWYSAGDVNETGRLMSLATRALLDQGIESPSKHLYLAATGRLATLILSRAPLTQGELTTLRETTDRLEYKVLVSPDREPASPVLKAIVMSPNAEALQSYTGAQFLDLTPPTDDRPFFFNQLPLSRFYKAIQPELLQDPGVLTGNIIATATLLLIIVLSSGLVVLAIVVPLRPAIRETDRALVVSGSAYFLLIGFGFMFIEIGLVQRLSVFLGHPVYSLSVVLFSIILFTGLGSFASERAAPTSRLGFGLWAGLTGLYAIALPSILSTVLPSFETSGTLLRACVAAGLIAPAGLLMGFGFPTGMRLVSARDERPTPWFWGINGAAGVLASALAVALSITYGIDLTLRAGAACYLLLIPVAAYLITARGAGTVAAAQGAARR